MRKIPCNDVPSAPAPNKMAAKKLAAACTGENVPSQSKRLRQCYSLRCLRPDSVHIGRASAASSSRAQKANQVTDVQIDIKGF